MSNKHHEYSDAHWDGKAAADRAHQDIPDVGMVGIASVMISPGTSGFARWLRKNAGASTRTGFWRGTHVPISSGKQAYHANLAAAQAYAKVIEKRFPDLTVMALCRAD